MVQMFAKNVGNIEEGIDHLYDLIEGEEEIEAAAGSLIELAEELQVALEACDAAVLGLIGYDEPKPEDDGLDFEESVLLDLAQIDNIAKEILFEARKKSYMEELHRRGFGFAV